MQNGQASAKCWNISDYVSSKSGDHWKENEVDTFGKKVCLKKILIFWLHSLSFH